MGKVHTGLRTLVRTARPLTRRYAASIVILGMHRSGTSFLTSILSDAGGETGEVLPPDAGNPAGYFENRALKDTNKVLLHLNGGSWFAPPDKIRARLRDRLKARAVLASFPSGSVPLLKDPRLVLTYDFWSSWLTNPVHLFCFRNPKSVAHSLQKRNDIALDEGLRIWNHYNKLVLRIADKITNPIWFNFDDIQASKVALSDACEGAGLQWSSECIDQRFDPSLVHSNLIDSSGTCENTYAELKRRWAAYLAYRGNTTASYER